MRHQNLRVGLSSFNRERQGAHTSLPRSASGPFPFRLCCLIDFHPQHCSTSLPPPTPRLRGLLGRSVPRLESPSLHESFDVAIVAYCISISYVWVPRLRILYHISLVLSAAVSASPRCRFKYIVPTHLPALSCRCVIGIIMKLAHSNLRYHQGRRIRH